ncbi:unnamed protein product [Candidula unifasciata]|uniref:PC-esterase domain-containing protein 1A n=1 Tax=Candidula unifasciata TaxID=100452 RepID=A0A8S3ZSC5_9EUPU|nr:unnamed protein product [Candidula unifasciata]
MEDFKFSTADITQALFNRFIVIIGDSNQRNIYKDLVLLLQTDRYLTERELRTKGETSFLDDELVEGGSMKKMSNGTNYREVRQYKTDVHLIRFYFVTRCYNLYMESILDDLQQSPFPDILIMNSCLWDITRYVNCNICYHLSIPDYKVNLKTLFTRLSECLPSNCLVIWNTTLPISSSARSGFLIPEVTYKAARLRRDILEANYYAHMVASKCGFDILDLHFYLRRQQTMRADDGIHWDMKAHRTISNLILTHIFEAWRIPVPRKQVTFGSYGSTHARNGYYQQIGKDRQQPLMSQPFQWWTNDRSLPLQPQPYHQHWVEDRQLQPHCEQWNEDRQEQPQYFEQWAEDIQLQPLPQNAYQQWPQGRQQVLLPQPLQLQPAHLQPKQIQPPQYIDFSTDTQAYSGNFEFGVGNVTFQSIQVFDPFVWQPYQQSSPYGSDPSHSHIRYQPYTHRRQAAAASIRYNTHY